MYFSDLTQFWFSEIFLELSPQHPQSVQMFPSCEQLLNAFCVLHHGRIVCINSALKNQVYYAYYLVVYFNLPLFQHDIKLFRMSIVWIYTDVYIDNTTY